MRFFPKKRLVILLLLLVAVIAGWRLCGIKGEGALSDELARRNGKEGMELASDSGQAVEEKEEAEPGGGRWSGEGTAPFRVVSCTPEETLVEFILPRYSIEDVADEEGRVWQRIEADGASTLKVSGMPALPLYRMEYGTAPGCAVKVTLRNAEYATIDACRPAPGQAMTFRGEVPAPVLPSPEVYGAGVVFPDASVRVASGYQLRGIQGDGVTVSRFLYDDARGNIRVLTRAVVSLRTVGASSAELDGNGDFAAIQRSFFINGPSFRSVSVVSSVGVLAMVMPEEWCDDVAVQEYVGWKKRMGWEVLLGRYPSETGEGRDGVLAWVRSQYEEHGLTHLMLVGDYGAIPPFQHATGKLSVHGATAYQKIASDTPYALLAGEGDLSYPDLFLGRIPVRNREFAARALARTVKFEEGKFTDSGWTKRGIYLGSNEASSSWPYWGVKDRTVILRQQQAIEGAGILQESSTYYDMITDQHSQSQEEVAADIDDGAAALFYLGHGGCVFFKTTRYSADQALRQDNGGRLPFVIAPVCDAGKLDHADFAHDFARDMVEYDIPSLGQALFESENATAGVAGAILSTDETLWEPPIEQLYAFTAALQRSREGNNRLSSQGAYALESLYAAVSFCDTYADDYYKSTEHHSRDNGEYTSKDGIVHAWEMELLGDPTVVCRIGGQVPLEVVLEEQKDALEISVKGLSEQAPSSVANCAVAVGTDEGGVVAFRTDAEGSVTLPLREIAGKPVRIRIVDGSGPMVEYPWRSVDADLDGCVSNGELLAWLAWWQEAFEPSAGAAEWMLSLREGAWKKWRENPDVEKPEKPEEPTVAGFAERLYEVDLALESGTLDALAQAGVVLKNIDGDQATALVNGLELENLLARDFEYLAIRDVAVVPPALGLEEIRNFQEELSAENWPQVRPAYLGMTEEGREITGVRISLAGEGVEVPQLLMMAGIHGNETAAVEQVLTFLREVRSSLEEGEGRVAELLKRCALWVVPVLNPDGYVAGKHDNLHGVDLERGFPDDPGRLAEGDACGLEAPWKYAVFGKAETCRPQREQSALVRWLVAHPVQAVLDVRQGDEYVAWGSPADAALAGKVAEAAEIARAIRRDERYPVAGTLQQWMVDYLECHALEMSIAKAGTSGSAAILRWLASALEGMTIPEDAETVEGSGAPVACVLPRQFLPGREMEVPVKVEAEEYPLAWRMRMPKEWQGGVAETEGRLVRYGEGFLDVVAMSSEDVEELNMLLKPSPEAESARLVWENQKASFAKVLVAAPERRVAMALSAGWNCLAVPLAGIRPEALKLQSPKDFSFWGHRECVSGCLEPGKGYWGWRETPYEGCVSGWWLDPRPVAVETGWQMLGTTAAHSLPSDAYRVENGVFLLLPAGAMVPAGTAYWRHCEEAEWVIP
ncbi:MAG: C25 family cysteine peptidase [Lentisphaeria bacterium]|nr:C25 family cysteine peptidase [Lentisphaeria bacterium]